MAGNSSTHEISTLLDRYLISLDRDCLDDAWAASLFTEDARVEFPISDHHGRVGLAEYHRAALAAHDRTQHLNSPAVVSVHGDHGTLHANVIATHVRGTDDARSLFVAGSLLRGAARRTPDGWRLSLLSFRLIWSTTSEPSR